MHFFAGPTGRPAHPVLQGGALAARTAPRRCAARLESPAAGACGRMRGDAMEYRDYYKILGLERAATAEQVKTTYRRLARKYHPDVSKEKNAEERFKEVQEAYEVLKDPEKRAAYNQLGADWKSGEQFRPPPDWGSGFEHAGAAPGRGRSRGGGARGRAGDGEARSQADFSDFFSSLF